MPLTGRKHKHSVSRNRQHPFYLMNKPVAQKLLAYLFFKLLLNPLDSAHFLFAHHL